jgi:hypothetical protein
MLSRADSQEAAVCCIEEDDEEIEYGKLYVHSLGDDSKVRRPLEADDIWPHWSEGVPTILRRTAWNPSFSLGKVYHSQHLSSESMELEWHRPHLLSVLRKDNRLLPSGKFSRHWNGVYRLFSPDTTIDRFCGKDPTGTLYLGRAGSERGWSILRTRIQEIARQTHHATSGWSHSDLLRQKFPWESLAIQWAYTETRLNYRGDTVPGAKMAESWLLGCYNDSFGEYPPMNQEG